MVLVGGIIDLKVTIPQQLRLTSLLRRVENIFYDGPRRPLALREGGGASFICSICFTIAIELATVKGRRTRSNFCTPHVFMFGYVDSWSSKS